MTKKNSWVKSKIGDHFEVTNGKTNTSEAVINGEYPLFDRSVEIKRSNKYLFDTEAIIMPGEGKEFIPQYYSGKFDLHQRAYAIYPRKTNGFNMPYLYYWMDQNKDYLTKMAVGSTVKSLRLYMLEEFPLIYPPKGIQNKIATIFMNIDEVIQKTDQIIQKTERLKSGLMNELLTKGIGHKKFKKTKLGEIPEEWALLSLQEMLDKGLITSHLDGNHGELYPKSSEFTDLGIPYISANNIRDKRVDFTHSKYLSELRAKQFKKGVAIDGDILFAHNATVGPVALLKTNYPFVVLSTSLTYYRCDPSMLNQEYLLNYLQSEIFKNQYQKIMSQTTRNQVPITAQRKLFHVVPPLEEQKAIADILSKIDEQTRINTSQREKLNKLKSGLMQDIFSQKVEIN